MKEILRRLLNKQSGQDLLGHGIINRPLEYKKSPLHHLHKECSARFITFGDSIWVDRYSESLDKEYEALHQDVAVCDISCVTMVALKANNILKVLQPCFSNKLITDRTFIMRYGALVGNDDKLFDDAIIFIRSPDHVFLTINASFMEFKDFLIQNDLMHQVDLTDLTQDYVKLQIQGPNAYSLLKQLFPDVPLIKSFHFIEHQDCIINSSGFTRVGGNELYLPVEKGIAIWKQLMEMRITPYGISTMEISRVEAKMICYGHEFSFGQQVPQELGFMTDYYRAPPEYVVNFAVFTHSSKRICHPPKIGDPVKTLRGETRGIMTSVVFSPYYDAYIGFCRLKTDSLDQNVEYVANNEPFIATPLKKNGLK